MKRFVAIFVFSISCVVLFAQHSYTFKFDKTDFRFHLKDSVLHINSLKTGAFYSDNTNAPALPYFTYRILRPAGTAAEKYNVDKREELLFENVCIAGNPLIQPTGEYNMGDSVRISTFSVDSPIMYSEHFSKYGYEYLYLKITPFVYDSKTKNLYFASKVRVSFPRQNVTKKESKYDSKKKNIVKALLYNSEEMEQFYPESNSANSSLLRSQSNTINNGMVDYAIITSQSLKSSFQELLEWKIQKGLRAKVYTLDDISSSLIVSGLTNDQDKIRRWINYMSTYSGLKYVLLGGDATVIPVKSCQAKYTEHGDVVTENVIADLYYSTYSLLSPTWDYNGNGIAGEYADLIDLEPQVYLTRAPVRTTSDVQYFTQKVLQYEKGNGLFSPSYVNKMLFAGTNYGSTSTYYWDEQACSNYIDNYWTGSRHYLYNDVSQTYTNLTTYNTLTKQNFVQLINSGYHFLHMDCHGSSSYWDLKSGYFNSDDASGCHNISGTIVATTACNTNAFNLDDCLSKSFMNSPHGALAYYGSSGWGLRYTNGGIALSLLYDVFFFNSLLTGEPTDAPYHYGAVAAHSKMRLADNASSSETDGYRYLQFAINPLGDPEMPIYTAVPQTFSNAQVSVDNYGSVIVSTGGIAGCTIALTSVDNGESYFNVVDNVSSYTFQNVTARCNVTITKHNYRPYRSSINYPGIEGNSYFWRTNIYQIDVPDDCSVTWTFANSSNNNMLYQDTSNPRRCLVSNLADKYICDNLIATIKRNNVTVATRYKHVTTSKDFDATIYQQGCTINGVTYPTITNVVGDNGHTGAFELCTLTLSSTDFADATFSLSGYMPSTWTKNSNGTITAVFPKITDNTAKVVTITGVNTVTEKIFQFTLHIQSSSSLNNMLNVIGCNGTYSISLCRGEVTGNRAVIVDDWLLKIYDANSGNLIYQDTVVNGTTEVNTSGWKPGIYIVQGFLDGIVTTEKIFVK